nr:MAG TPA: hypothetical protein [Caudoviricetes sp.]DAX29999.1 MAG TPA: hypothetical protein [Caudoviricetes sp.]
MILTTDKPKDNSLQSFRKGKGRRRCAITIL